MPHLMTPGGAPPAGTVWDELVSRLGKGASE